MPEEDTDIVLPPFSQELIDKLEALYPDQSPDMDWPDRKIWVSAGENRVIRFLRSQFNRQNNLE